jgi:hypothetical protein
MDKSPEATASFCASSCARRSSRVDEGESRFFKAAFLFRCRLLKVRTRICEQGTGGENPENMLTVPFHRSEIPTSFSSRSSRC